MRHKNSCSLIQIEYTSTILLICEWTIISFVLKRLRYITWWFDLSFLRWITFSIFLLSKFAITTRRFNPSYNNRFQLFLFFRWFRILILIQNSLILLFLIQKFSQNYFLLITRDLFVLFTPICCVFGGHISTVSMTSLSDKILFRR